MGPRSFPCFEERPRKVELVMDLFDLLDLAGAREEHADLDAWWRTHERLISDPIGTELGVPRGNSADVAELFVVDELVDRGIFAAYGAIGVPAQAELPEFLSERVVLEQPTDERVALSQ